VEHIPCLRKTRIAYAILIGNLKRTEHVEYIDKVVRDIEMGHKEI
jgi:hypothetical protein